MKTHRQFLVTSLCLIFGVQYLWGAVDSNVLSQELIQLKDTAEYAQVLTLYEQVVSQCPSNVVSDPNSVGFKEKYSVGLLAIKNGDHDAVKTIAAEIMALKSSPQQKPGQLFSAGLLFENAGFVKDALEVYQQVIAKYPDSPESRPDYAGFKVKYFPALEAMEKRDDETVKKTAADIQQLNSSPLVKPNHLYVAGFLLENVKVWEDAQSIYQQVINEYPHTSWAQTARVHLDGVELLKVIESGDLAAAKTGTAALEAKYAGSRTDLSGMLFVIAEAFYTEGIKHNNSEFIEQSAKLFEKDMLQSLAQKSPVYYMLGLNYEHLGDYAKAANAFEESYQADSKFIYADYCLYAQGQCYEKLVESKTISITQAKPFIQRVYSEFITKYPNSSCVSDACHWIENNK